MKCRLGSGDRARGVGLQVAIVGAGLGGLALALALSRYGVASTIFERAAVLEEVGAGIQLSPNAMKCLSFLGLEQDILRISTVPEAVYVCDAASNHRLLTTPLGEAARRRWLAPYLQAHRADLQAVLLRAVKAAGCAVLLFGAEAQIFSDEGVTTTAGARYPSDVIVGCDGVRSSVRRQIVGDRPARFTGEVAWRCLVPVDELPSDVPLSTTMVWTGPKRHFVQYPVRGGRLLNVVAVTEAGAWREESWSQPGDKASLQAAFCEWPRSVQDVLAAAQGVMRWGLYDRSPLSRWTRGRVTLLGDAAHPMSPFLAQGAAMAIEDAVVLARALVAEPDLSRALFRYEGARRARTAKTQAWSRRNATLFHLPSAAARGVFGAARQIDRVLGVEAAARLDWLYGYDAPTVDV